MQYTRIINRKTTLAREGGSLSSCFSWTPLGDTWTTSTSTAGGEVTYQEDNPGWRRQIARGQNATTPFNANDIRIIFAPGFCDSRRVCRVLTSDGWVVRYGRETVSGFINDGFSDVTMPSAPSTDVDQEVDARARLEWIKRARSAQGALRGATMLAELADTLRTIRNPARALRESVDSYSAAARRRVAKATGRDPRGVRVRDLSEKQRRAAQRALSESWLEAQFGWLPLISDIEDGVKAYDKLSGRDERAGVSSRASSKSAPTISFPAASLKNLNIRTEVHTYVVHEVQYYGAVKVTMSSFSGRVSEEAGLRVRDFAPALWEWIPYSFLVDYFTNIGDIVEAASFPRSDVAWCARTIRNTSTRDGSRMTIAKNSSVAYPLTNHVEVLAAYPSTLIIERKYVERDKYLGSFVPSFQWEIPGSRNFKKYLNIAALASLRGMRR